jgi:hypothetical protein
LGKPYAIIIWYYWEHLGEQLGEQIGKRGAKKTSPQPAPKEKNRTPRESMLSLLIGCMKLLFSKLFVTNFGLR